ncbi:hypothetical protein BZA05DRAFT_381668 [Tricharina praecox]|uniref:uncharacterized protein n=1 Tax=Tricharina praecox TaxID=43433 RepID=UPI00221F5A0C|nr:uncharacterized protein BZA05DRAFT_381668 [Tricharina praecox]KAI5858571.1 hypothetical protein BZA05DRAFT_381668 [Tricharina praecox]
MFLIFPGLLYVLYDCLLYVVRSLVYTGATAKAARGPDGRGRGRGSVASLSDGEDGEDDEEDEKKEKQVTAAA